MKVEFLLVSPLFERIVQPYLRNLERLGVKGSIRMVDSAQYTRRLNVFDYDIVVGNFAQSDSPGNEQRDYWGSDAADREGCMNLIGIKSPAIDKLIDRVIFAKDREELIAATRALDRVLLVERFRGAAMVFAEGAHRLLEPLRPAHDAAGADAGFLQVWWFDQTLAAQLPGPSKL